jgi:very-short-patch-repair endonuclease
LARRRDGERPTGSDLETLCLQLYRRGGLHPSRQWEVRNGRGELLGFGDFGWPPKAFITEVDGLATHGPEDRQYDYSRQARIEDEGYTFRRFTRDDVLWRAKYVCDTTSRGIALARPL